jgi:aryl-alcohol dehydrogenase-like predicted oxidoreductase
MHYRKLGRTPWNVSEISFGAWAIGSAWGSVDDRQSMAALHRAVDLGVNFIDTADVYGDGHSERLIAKLRKERPGESIVVATKAGRRLPAQTPQGYTRENLQQWIDRSLENLQADRLDLVQLHCPPNEVYYMPEVFGMLDDLCREGKILHYGVSVEKVEQAIKAIEYPNVQSVQIIFNLFRQRPANLFLELAEKAQVGILARVPLASGLLTGKFHRDSTFSQDDHRQFNRHGEQFDRGETFSGVDLETGLEAVEAIRSLLPTGVSMPQLALRWILMHPAISCAIPGAKRPDQVDQNISASDLPPLPDALMEQLSRLYQDKIAPSVHHRW